MCKNECIEDCDKINFFLKSSYYELSDSRSEVTINIIPDKWPHMRYIETLQMDFNQLIYGCGGIIGL
jgi:hypothetical protein